MHSIFELNKMAVELLQCIPYYDPKDFVIRLEYVKTDMTPSIYIDNNEYHLDIYERGQLIHRESTTDVDMVLYWILESTIGLYADKKIWNKYFDGKRIVYTDEIREEQRYLRLKLFEFIGDKFFELYSRKHEFFKNE